MGNQEIGLVGLGVMGRNLALNLAGKGFSVAAHDAWPEQNAVMRTAAGTLDIKAFDVLTEFVDALDTPRRILMMVKAGDVVDETIARLKPLLRAGDLLIDGGNSLFTDTMRRCRALEAEGFLFIGTGVSGGEEGALHGPSIMPGGAREAYALVASMFEAISAKVAGEPCCAYMGPDGAGHFVKMVHNGIEYGDMQLICESWDLLRHAGGFSNTELSGLFAAWNKGELDSYLVEITADILRKVDPETGKDLVDLVLDKAGQKGTGAWASQHALEIGMPIPTITEAVSARSMSALKKERVAASVVLTGPATGTVSLTDAGKAELAETVRKALFAGKIASYAQGFALMAETSRLYDWHLQMGTIAKIFRGGCIIRASFLNDIMAAYDGSPDIANLMITPFFAERLNRYAADWRKTVCTAVEAGIPMPALASALAYFDGYRSANLPANLLQAQRDCFGAHRYERIDREGSFHSSWQ